MDIDTLSVMELAINLITVIGVIASAMVFYHQELKLIKTRRDHRIPGYCNCKPGDDSCLNRDII